MFKKNNKVYIHFIVFLLVCSNITFAQSTRLGLDWSTKIFGDTNRLPFDEPFEIYLSHVSVADTYTISIVDIDKDSTVYNTSLPALSGNLNFVIDKRLPPNHSYKISVSDKANRPLTTSEQDELIAKIGSDQNFIQKVNNMFYKTDFKTLNLESFKQLTDEETKHLGYLNYKLIIPNEEQKSFKYDIGKIGNSVLKIKYKMKEINTYILSNTQDRAIAMQLPNITFTKEMIPIVDLSAISISDYIENINNIQKQLKETYKTDSQKLKEIDLEFSKVNNINDGISEVDKLVQSLLKATILKTIVANLMIVDFLQSTNVNFNTEAAIYTSQTFGYGYSPGTANGLFYFAFTIYARPVNNKVPLSKIPGFWGQLGARAGLNFGFTLEDIYSNNRKKVAGLGSIAFDDRAGLIGLGIRIFPFFKIDVNALCYYAKNPNPLIDTKKFVCSPFFGASLSLNLAKIISGQPNSLTTLQTELKKP